VARFGGDEFVIVSENGDPHHGAVLGRRIADVLEVPFEAAQVSAVPRASIGTVVGGARDTAEGLLKKADLAMYEAKHRGRGRVEAFHQDFQARLDHRVSLEAALRSAVEEGGFRLVYQPIVSLDSGRIVGAEALLRWDAPDPAWSMPDAFIGLAEEIGLSGPIGSWVNAEVARQLRAWSPFLQDDPDFSVSVNLSGLQLTPDLADFLISLREHNIEPGRVTFELTETVLIADAEPLIEALLGLRLLGAGLAIDDFGTGYSSLSYLERLPVDSIKIDRSFVEGLGQKRQSVAIVSAIIRMAAALGLRVTAEGVETEEQFDMLVDLGCTRGQGFYWSAGVSGAELAALLEAPTPVRPQAAAAGSRSLG
jgi:EAL domain-containing protein (putative c-di-GMP-specific phosphodiesterase class I)